MTSPNDFHASSPIRFEHATRGFLRVLWGIALGLVGIHVLLNVIHYQWHELPWLMRQIFDVDEEDSFPTWFSAMILLLASLASAINARQAAQSGNDLAPQWTALGIGFLLLSIDEIAGMHETLNSLIDISWTIPGGIIAAFAAGFFVPFLFKLPRGLAVRLVISGLVYLGGALGVEVMTDPYAEDGLLNTLTYNLWTGVEEFMEMAGVLVFIEGTRRHLLMRSGGVARLEQTLR